MTDNDKKNNAADEIDMEDLGEDGFDDDQFEDFETGTTLSEMWKENPVVKLGAVAGGVSIIIAAIILFGGKKNPPPPSLMPQGSDVSAPPGTEEVSPVYREAVEEQNVQMIESARRKGESALPVPITPAVGRLEKQEPDEVEEDPLALWRRMQEEQNQKQQSLLNDQQALWEQQQQRAQDYAEATQTLSEAMVEQMSGILEGKNQKGAQYMLVTSPEFFQEQQAAEQAAQQAAAANAAQNTSAAATKREILVPAGDIEYAQLLLEANSDIPGPVLAQIVSGPLAGSRILGSFRVEEEFLVLEFSQVIIDKESYGIDAIALDPDTTTSGMATEVDHRYLKRVLLPAAAEFVKGVGEAISESGSTSVTVNSAEGSTTTEDTKDYNLEDKLAKGVSEGADEIAQFMEDEANSTEVLVRVAAGTPMGILFLDPVYKDKPESGAVRTLTNPLAVDN